MLCSLFCLCVLRLVCLYSQALTAVQKMLQISIVYFSVCQRVLNLFFAGRVLQVLIAQGKQRYCAGALQVSAVQLLIS